MLVPLLWDNRGRRKCGGSFNHGFISGVHENGRTTSSMVYGGLGVDFVMVFTSRS